MSAGWSRRTMGQLGVLLAVVVLAVVYRGSLIAWFTGQPVQGPGMSGGGAVGVTRIGDGGLQLTPRPAPAALPRLELSPPALQYVHAALGAYEAARASLADDELEGLEARARELAVALHAAEQAALQDQEASAARGGAEAHGTTAARAQIARELRQAAESAEQLAVADKLQQARVRFSVLSEKLIALATADPRLRQGLHVFSCPMVEGFNEWLQRSSELDNPYMGARMPSCGTEAGFREPGKPHSDARSDAGEHAHGGGEIAHYTCSMHPAVREQRPGKCPICGMDLTPVSRAELESGVITVDPGRRQAIGVKTARVTMAPLVLPVRALGVVVYDETKLVDVTLKLDGYIHDLRADATGEPVVKGDVLFTLYSPELYAAQEEYLLARSSENATSASMVGAAERRLTLWGLTKSQIEGIAKKSEPIENMPFFSPASGFVLEKNVVEGGSVRAGERLFRIVPLKTVWVEANVFEHELPLVEVGQPARVTLPYRPGQSYVGRVSYVYPTLDKQTRTGKVRIELPNRELTLKPNMYADVRFEVDAGEQLQVPESAVLHTGPRTLVFVDLGEGRLRPQLVKLGREGEHGIEVLEGLAQGDLVVTSGNFLIAAESRIRSAADSWSGSEDEAR